MVCISAGSTTRLILEFWPANERGEAAQQVWTERHQDVVVVAEVHLELSSLARLRAELEQGTDRRLKWIVDLPVDELKVPPYPRTSPGAIWNVASP